MGRLVEILEREKRVILSGPYGTEVAERVARDMTDHPQKASGVLNLQHIGAGCSALLSEEGQTYLREIAKDYVRSVRLSQTVAVVTPTFRIAKQTLESAARLRGIDARLPHKGLELLLDAIILTRAVMVDNGRDSTNSVLAMSAGTPFESYMGELTFPDIANKYAPQIFAALRFRVPDAEGIDYVMFETVPSLKAAIGAAEAFTQSHKTLNVVQSTGQFVNSGTITYLGSLLSKVKRYVGKKATHQLCPSYDPVRKVFEDIEQTRDYVISLCLEKDATLNWVDLNEAMDRLYERIDQEGWQAPVGIGINCNSPTVTRKALESLTDENRARMIGIHPNASSVDNPREYNNMSAKTAIPTDQFTEQVISLVKAHDLQIVGGCCGTNHETMSAIYQELNVTQ